MSAHNFSHNAMHSEHRCANPGCAARFDLRIEPPIAIKSGCPMPPRGCLGCNHDPVAAYLEAVGIDKALFVEVPAARHAWSDISTCGECGRTWLRTKPIPTHIPQDDLHSEIP